jgi:CheY-like chemotaxis protein
MKSILVIEHDGALQKILQRLFSAEGYEVDVVPDGTAGLEMLRQRPPVAVILDIERSAHNQGAPCLELERSLPSEVAAISPFVDRLMPLIRKCLARLDRIVQRPYVHKLSQIVL